MNKIMVVAEMGLRVPLAHNPHEYIEQTPVAVDGDDVYYRRAIADGDLLVLNNDAPLDAGEDSAMPETAERQPENELAHLSDSQKSKKGK